MLPFNDPVGLLTRLNVTVRFEVAEATRVIAGSPNTLLGNALKVMV